MYIGLVSVDSLLYFTACIFPTVVIMSSQPTVIPQPIQCGACVVWMVGGYVVGGTLVSGTTQKCTIATKNTVLYTTQTLQHTQRTVVIIIIIIIVISKAHQKHKG